MRGSLENASINVVKAQRNALEEILLDVEGRTHEAVRAKNELVKVLKQHEDQLKRSVEGRAFIESTEDYLTTVRERLDKALLREQAEKLLYIASTHLGRVQAARAVGDEDDTRRHWLECMQSSDALFDSRFQHLPQVQTFWTQYSAMQKVMGTDLIMEQKAAKGEGEGSFAFYTALQMAVEGNTDGIATICGDRKLTWLEFMNEVEKLASVLRLECGVSPGDRVVLLNATNTDRFLIAYFAIPIIGATVVPVNYRMAPEHVIFQLRDSAPKCVIVDDVLKVLVPVILKLPKTPTLLFAGDTETPSGCLGYKNTVARADTHDFAPSSSVAEFGFFYSAPPTGASNLASAAHKLMGADNPTTQIASVISQTPRRVAVKYANLLQSCQNFTFDSTSNYMHSLPFYHLASIVVSLVLTRAGGTHVLLNKQFGPESLFEAIEKAEVNVLFGLPALFSVLQRFPKIGDYDRTSVKFVLLGTAQPTDAVTGIVAKLFPSARVLKGYGFPRAVHNARLASLQPNPNEVAAVGSTSNLLKNYESRKETEVLKKSNSSTGSSSPMSSPKPLGRSYADRKSVSFSPDLGDPSSRRVNNRGATKDPLGGSGLRRAIQDIDDARASDPTVPSNIDSLVSSKKFASNSSKTNSSSGPESLIPETIQPRPGDAVAERARIALSSLISRPALTVKKLALCDFTYVKNILCEVIKATGFGKELFKLHVLQSTYRFKDKSVKLAFLDDMIHLVNYTLNDTVDITSQGIVDEVEAEDTCGFLIKLVEAVGRGPQATPAAVSLVQRERSQLPGGSASPLFKSLFKTHVGESPQSSKSVKSVKAVPTKSTNDLPFPTASNAEEENLSALDAHAARISRLVAKQSSPRQPTSPRGQSLGVASNIDSPGSLRRLSEPEVLPSDSEDDDPVLVRKAASPPKEPAAVPHATTLKVTLSDSTGTTINSDLTSAPNSARSSTSTELINTGRSNSSVQSSGRPTSRLSSANSNQSSGPTEILDHPPDASPTSSRSDHSVASRASHRSKLSSTSSIQSSSARSTPRIVDSASASSHTTSPVTLPPIESATPMGETAMPDSERGWADPEPDEPDDSLYTRTRKRLKPMIVQVPLTEKLLSNPPFRFLKDLFLELIDATGFGLGLYTADEISSPMKSKDERCRFLNKMLVCVGHALEEEVLVTGRGIVAGADPDATNVFLHQLADAARRAKDLDVEAAVAAAQSAPRHLVGGRQQDYSSKRITLSQAQQIASTTSMGSLPDASSISSVSTTNSGPTTRSSHRSRDSQNSRPTSEATTVSDASTVVHLPSVSSPSTNSSHKFNGVNFVASPSNTKSSSSSTTLVKKNQSTGHLEHVAAEDEDATVSADTRSGAKQSAANKQFHSSIDHDYLYITKTQEMLGAIISRPPLSFKWLSKPPHRYLSDVWKEVGEATGFGRGLFTSQELEMSKSKAQKVAFLEQIFEVVGLAIANPPSIESFVNPVTCKAQDVVAGDHPEATNKFLCQLAEVAQDESVESESIVAFVKEQFRPLSTVRQLGQTRRPNSAVSGSLRSRSSQRTSGSGDEGDRSTSRPRSGISQLSRGSSRSGHSPSRNGHQSNGHQSSDPMSGAPAAKRTTPNTSSDGDRDATHDLSFTERTIVELGRIIQRPPLTPKVLSRPPFRFIRDVFTEVSAVTGVGQGLFDDFPTEPQSKHDKVAWLKRLVKFVNLALSPSHVTVNVRHIVAGVEPEQTNEFLVQLAKVARRKDVDSDAIVRRIVGADSDLQSRASSAGQSEAPTMSQTATSQSAAESTSIPTTAKSGASDPSEYIEATRKALSGILTRVPLTKKLLKRPPFRFLRDVIQEIIEVTGFAKGLYNDDEESGTSLNKHQKADYFRKLIDCVGAALGESVEVSAREIVAGERADRTNLFLQLLARVAQDPNVDSDAAVSKALALHDPDVSSP